MESLSFPLLIVAFLCMHLCCTEASFIGVALPEHYAADTEHIIPLRHVILTLSTTVIPLSIIAEHQAGGGKSTYFSVLEEEITRYNEGEPVQTWAYVNVRPKAHMFYWLYETTDENVNKPLIMWLQGGPGGSSTGFGNFEELGPLDVNLNPRNTSWLHAASLLFVDNPVGAGFSYVDDDTAYATDVGMVATDMLVLLEAFFMKSESGQKFQTTPFFIFCESYGGKMTAAISEVLYKAMMNGEIKVNFKGLALGDSWISPLDSTVNWAPYLYTNSLVDLNGMTKIQNSAKQIETDIKSGLWKNATMHWDVTQVVLEKYTHGVNFYNILKWGAPEPSYNKLLSPRDHSRIRILAPLQTDKLTALMNGPIRKKLQIIPEKVKWGGQSDVVFEKMTEDFMKPVIDTVNRLIQNTSLYVVVYTGQLDLIVNTVGTEKWIQTLDIYPSFYQATRHYLLDPVTKKTSGFLKTYKNFSLYWILDAGHMVPQDNGNTALMMVKQVINYPNVHRIR